MPIDVPTAPLITGHVVHARFEDRSRARRAVQAARRLLPRSRRGRLVLRRPDRTDDTWVAVQESDARRGLWTGALSGGLAGVCAALGAGLLVGSAQLSLAAVVGFGAAAGAAFGLLGGALMGLALPSAEMATLIDHAGHDEAIVTVAVRDAELGDRLTRVLQAHGADEVVVRAA